MTTESSLAISTEVLSLPEVWTVRSGYTFHPQDDHWSIPDSSGKLSLNFSKLRPLCTDGLIHSLKKVLLWYFQNRAPAHASNMFNRFKSLVDAVTADGEILSVVADRHIINYRASLPREVDYHLGAISGFMQRWWEMGYPGVSADTYALLKKLSFERNRVGWNVLTMDPESGPYTEIELQAIHRAINNGFARGDINNREFSLVWLFMATGARSVQIADLKVKDILIRKTQSGITEYLVQMPKAKQRFTPRRSGFKCRPLAREIGEVLEAWIFQLRQNYLDRGVVSERFEDLSVFPLWNKDNPPGFEHHSNSQDLRNEISSVFSRIEVCSHRTGDVLHLTPQRFRYTLGTRAAQEKLGLLVIAEMLDHADTQTAIVYTKATPEIIEQIDEALAKDLAPLAQAFAGKIVISDEDADRADDPASLVRQPGGTPGQDGVGRCGRCGTCSAPAPIACYTCGNFQAWLEGPHEEVLRGLLADRQRVMEVTGDERIAHVNDHVILAVAQVVEMCKTIRAEREVAQ